MKKTLVASLLIWMLMINIGKVWPISNGDRYYRTLQKWYMFANKGEWEKAKALESSLKAADIEDFSKKNKTEELEKRYKGLENKKNKNADDWMEIAVLLYRLNKKDEAYKAIESAHNLDPIREDISKVFFTYRTSQQLPQRP